MPNEAAIKMPSKPVTVTILTKNEESIIERCIASVAWADEILVVDSGSTDRTVEIAERLGARVLKQSWLGWVPQRQFAITSARNDWVLVIDADEIVTPELREGILAAMAANPDPQDGYVVDRRDEFFGRLFPNMKRPAMRRSFVRLLNRQTTHYVPDDLIHERVLCPGRALMLPGVLLHWRAFTVTDQMGRYVQYSPLEAETMQRAGVHAGPARLLLMPLLRFLWCYVYCGGFRLGTTGLVQAMMTASCEFTRHAVLWERQSVQRRLHPPQDVWRMPPSVTGVTRSSHAAEASRLGS